MKAALGGVSVLLSVLACGRVLTVDNHTRPAGYALGEKVPLEFAVTPSTAAPDSIEVTVVERKTGYAYSLWARKRECNEGCSYVAIWDGRKSDGSWPAGGHYLVFARAGSTKPAWSDTVEIGLAD